MADEYLLRCAGFVVEVSLVWLTLALVLGLYLGPILNKLGKTPKPERRSIVVRSNGRCFVVND